MGTRSLRKKAKFESRIEKILALVKEGRLANLQDAVIKRLSDYDDNDYEDDDDEDFDMDDGGSNIDNQFWT